MANVNHSHGIWVLKWSNVIVINFTTTNLIIIIIVLLFYSFDVGIISLILPLTSANKFSVLFLPLLL